MSPEQVEQVLAQSEREHRSFVQERLDAIRRAEAADPEKQRFDIAALAELYDLTDEEGIWHDDPGRDLNLEHRYWVRHPEVRTIAEFAAALQRITASGET